MRSKLCCENKLSTEIVRAKYEFLIAKAGFGLFIASAVQRKMTLTNSITSMCMKKNMQCWLCENLPEVDFVMMLPLTHYGEKV